MPNKICFDLDGTIVDFYGYPNWRECLDNYDPTPYLMAKPLVDMGELVGLLEQARSQGYEICITTWLSKTTTEEFKSLVRLAKRVWLNHYDFPYDHFHGIQYGSDKTKGVRKYLKKGETAIIFDDDRRVRDNWTIGTAYDPTKENICDILRKMLDKSPAM